MATIKFTNALKRFYPNLEELTIVANNVNNVLAIIEKEYPGIKNYIIDDQGTLRKHVNIFINGEIIKDRIKLSDKINEQDEVYIIQALSGG